MSFFTNGNLNQRQFNMSILVWVAITTLLCVMQLSKSNKNTTNTQKLTEYEKKLVEKEVENKFLKQAIDSMKNDVRIIKETKEKIYIKYEDKKATVAKLPLDSAINFFTRELP